MKKNKNLDKNTIKIQYKINKKNKRNLMAVVSRSQTFMALPYC